MGKYLDILRANAFAERANYKATMPQHLDRGAHLIIGFRLGRDTWKWKPKGYIAQTDFFADTPANAETYRNEYNWFWLCFHVEYFGLRKRKVNV